VVILTSEEWHHSNW